jgi:hypothetical protein
MTQHDLSLLADQQEWYDDTSIMQQATTADEDGDL